MMNPANEAAVATEAPALVFTDSAATKVGELIREEGNPNLKLRVFVSGGGCSGFQYGFTFDEKLEDGDTQVRNEGVTLLIDPMSIQYLAGAEIDPADHPLLLECARASALCNDAALRSQGGKAPPCSGSAERGDRGSRGGLQPGRACDSPGAGPPGA